MDVSAQFVLHLLKNRDCSLDFVLFSYSFFLPHTFDLAPMLPLSLPFALFFIFYFFNRLHSGIRCVVIVVL